MNGYQHTEAFCLMLYRNEASGREEWIWNARDGVTPFIIRDAEDGGEMKHADWFRDVRAPFHVPPVGSRVFVDMTETRARSPQAQRHWAETEGTEWDARKQFASVEELAEVLAASYMQPGAPDILVVNSAMQEEFRARRPPPRPPARNRFA